jgi:hypothetical protein
MNRSSLALVLFCSLLPFCSLLASAQNQTTAPAQTTTQSAARPQAGPAQTSDRWAAWQPFLGVWQGTGSGQPGQGAGEFTPLRLNSRVPSLCATTTRNIPRRKTKPLIVTTI